MSSTLGTTLWALFFLLIPGLAGLKAFLRTYVRLDDLTRFDKLALAGVLGGGTLGVVLLFANWDCWSTELPKIANNLQSVDLAHWSENEDWCGESSPVTLSTLESLPLLVLIGMIGTQSIIASIGGGFAGWYLNRIEDGPSRERKYVEQPWEFVSRNTYREDESATVITVQGDEITGTVHRLGTPSEDYDILLESPTKILRDQNDNIIKERNLGDFSYHHYQDISQVRMDLAKDLDAVGPQNTDTGQSASDDEETTMEHTDNESHTIDFDHEGSES